jgi:iron(III) transport system substrate-binding protein
MKSFVGVQGAVFQKSPLAVGDNMNIKKLKTKGFIVFLVSVVIIWAGVGCAGKTEKEVVVYTSLDQVFSEPILKTFEVRTGIKVKAVYDVEASKTTGLVNRLLAEKNRPKADVFWNSEIGRTIVLKQKGVLAPYVSPSARDIPVVFKDKDGYWTGFAARARVLIYNTEMVHAEQLPKSILELIEPRWKGKVALAYPLFGTTATHVAALYAVMGKEKTEAYLTALKNNHIIIVEGNAVARDMVVEGNVPLAFTDTDDANMAVRAGKPVKIIYPDHHEPGTLLIPNSAALIKNGPNPGEAKILIDYLLSREVESKLAFSGSAQIPVRKGVNTPAHVPTLSSIRALSVDYYEIAKYMDRAARFCRWLFIR